MIPAGSVEQLLDDAEMVEAHDRRAAARQVDGDVVAIPERALRS